MNMNNNHKVEAISCLITIRRDEAEALKAFIEANAASYFEAIRPDFSGMLNITRAYDQIVKAIHYSSASVSVASVITSETGITVGKKEDML